MANENADDVVEQHLLKKISHAIENLGKEKNPVQDLMEALSKKTRAVKDWPNIRRANLYCLSNLLTDWQNMKNQSSLLPKEVCASWGSSLGKRLNEMRKEVRVCGTESSSGADHDGSVGPLQESYHPTFKIHKGTVYRWSSRHGPTIVYGFDHMVMAMERDLLIHNIQALGVVGVAGIGKTTLCQLFFARKLVKEHFSPRIWVCLSTQPNEDKDYRKEIVIRILRCLGIEEEVISDAANSDDGLRRLILLLRLQLTGRRYLIILDDAWNDDEFFFNLTQKEQLVGGWGEELAYGLPKGCGGAIISSSRSKALLKKMLGKDVSLQHLERQTDEIIKKIFKDTVIRYDEVESAYDPHLEELEKEILRNCDGIPLAAKLFAKIAREKQTSKPKQEPSASDGEGNKSKPAAGGGGGKTGAGDSGVEDGEHKGR